MRACMSVCACVCVCVRACVCVTRLPDDIVPCLPTMQSFRRVEAATFKSAMTFSKSRCELSFSPTAMDMAMST